MEVSKIYHIGDILYDPRSGALIKVVGFNTESRRNRQWINYQILRDAKDGVEHCHYFKNFGSFLRHDGWDYTNYIGTFINFGSTYSKWAKFLYEK